MDEDDDDIEWEEGEVLPYSDAEYIDYAKGVVILPDGAGWFASLHNASAIRIQTADGKIEVLDLDTRCWREIGKPELRSVSKH